MLRTILCFFIITWSFAVAAKLNVAFMTPELKGDIFWDQTVEVAKKAASDLDINLILIEGENHRLINQKVLTLALNKLSNIDYFIFMPQTGKSVKSFELLNHRKIKFVTLESDYNSNELKQIGRPGDVFPFWLGEVTYDDVSAGKVLADALISESVNPSNANIIAFSGGHDVISANREQGLSSVLSNKITLHQIVKTNWDPNIAQRKMQKLLYRYPKANILWAASDDIALAAMSKLSDYQVKNMIIGGIDMTFTALNAIEDGKLTVTVGGHFMQAGWALVKIHDYQNGINTFNNKLFTHSVVTKNNIKKYKKLINEEKWRDLNFNSFSIYQSGNKSLKLNLDSFLANLEF